MKNIFKTFAILIAVFFAYGTANAEKLVPAKIDASKLTSNTASRAVQKCGLDLLTQLRRFSVCKTPGYGCYGSQTNQNQLSGKAVSADETQLDLYFGTYNNYSDYHAYNGKSYSLKYVAFTANKAGHTLNFSFTEEAKDDGLGQSYNKTTPLTTVGDMPILRFNKKEIKHCSHDEWGNEHCEASTVEYSNPQWVLGDKYAPVVKWMNSDTKVELDKTANFAQFMTCVEQNIR